jgi:hypothetical protein
VFGEKTVFAVAPWWNFNPRVIGITLPFSFGELKPITNQQSLLSSSALVQQDAI